MKRAFFLLILSVTAFSHAEDAPSVEQLAWMTGSWDGPGPAVLEENWGLPRAGTIVSLVRQTTPEGTAMVEIVSIEEANGTLELYIQQWDVPFTPRTAGAQKMTLRDMTENSVTFEAVTEGSLQVLKYSRPAADEFHVDVVVAGGQQFVIPLKKQQR